MARAEKPLADRVSDDRAPPEREVRAEDLLRLHAELLRAKRLSAVGELAANVTHDVNNALTVIMGQAQLLLLGSLPDEASERIHKLYAEAGQAARMVQSLLHFSRDHEGPRRVMEGSDLVSRVLDLMHYRLQAEHIRVVTDLQPVPPVEVNGPQLQQAIFNVIQNAQQVMAAAHGGGILTVRTRAAAGTKAGAPETVRIEIEDDGPGISQEILDQIFDPFYTTRPGEGGAGLGLSISREIVVDHGGKIWAENRPAGGAVFIIELPAIRVSKRRTSPDASGVRGPGSGF